MKVFYSTNYEKGLLLTPADAALLTEIVERSEAVKKNWGNSEFEVLSKNEADELIDLTYIANPKYKELEIPDEKTDSGIDQEIVTDGGDQADDFVF